MTLDEALQRFNRKERYWLLRNALGSASSTLGLPFRDALGATLTGLKIPEQAWWAMDYHLDWLVGALALYQNSAVIGEAQPNPGSLVHGHHGDIDLVVAFGSTLILIEAKGDTPWNNEQLNTKLDRLEAILGDALSERPGAQRLSVYFVLMSPTKPIKLSRTRERSWPAWMLNADQQLRWTPLLMADEGQPPNFLKVVRCSAENGAVSRDGDCWKMQKA